MKKTEELYDAMENGLLSIRQVINMVKARPAHLMAPKHVAAPLTTTSTSAARAGKASVEYVRLQREEHANMIVLSGAENGENTSSTDVGPTAIESDSDSDGFFYQLDLADVMTEMKADQKLAMEGDTLASFARERTVATPESEDEEYRDSLSLSLSEGPDVGHTQTSENPQQMSDENRR
ncbi:hypothetical protein JG688_00004767 [Phytophthora aleatoria]|uniref:Uncharacterized protein n=1 Tax=Phytophthora aleatoria TaxID=2496075 RepID=A0A8J5MB35_9STRA|nr:hypothetical protein JG688_00004767 [Phytophthora aleatoria]